MPTADAERSGLLLEGRSGDGDERFTEAYPEVGDLGFASGVLGTRYVPDDTALEDGAEVALLPPVSGGSGEDPYELGVFELSAESIDPAACSARPTACPT